MPSPLALRIVFTLTVSLGLAPALGAQTASTPTIQPKKEVRMSALAKGSFEVTLVPLTEGNRKGAWVPDRLSIDKQFKGDLEATSQGEMMTAMSEVKGSGGYAAFERVQGTLGGRRGGFTLQHHGVMTQAVPGEWMVVVVPDSGTGELKGLAGKLTITMTGKQHAYALEYTLPELP
jgi:hypothetical protein